MGAYVVSIAFGDELVTVEIVLLAMVALFVGLRLYSVLGRRTGHEQQPVIRPADPVTEPEAAVSQPAEPVADRAERRGLVYEDAAAPGIKAIISADPGFDVARFLEGAQAAYRMILEAFWSGDRDTLADLTGGDVRASFDAAIAEREAAGQRLDNRLVAIERAVIENAELEGRTASITVRFDADIAAVTRDKDGEVIAGSLTDAVQTHDLWTFRRTLGSGDPNWLLVDTDEA
jgi:predicted lipid-binding transport protein (Tim44 family)